MTVSRTLFSAKRSDWGTPPELVPADVDLDVCATPENAKAARFYTPEQNGLILPWPAGHAWCNPPYGRGVGAWLKKGLIETQRGRCARVTYLLPARTDTQWWHMYVEGNPLAHVRFLKGRIRFVGAPGPAPFPSVFVTFNGPL